MLKILFAILIIYVNFSLYGQIENGSFEVWDSISECQIDYAVDLLSETGISDSGIPINWESNTDISVCRTMDNVNGSYSMVIGTFYTYQNTILSTIVNLPSDKNYLTGYYKSIIETDSDKDSIASCQIKIINQNTIKYESKTYFKSSNEFLKFEIPIPAVVNNENDSLIIEFRNSDEVCNSILYPECDFLFLDDIKLDLILKTESNSTIPKSIFPNPNKNGTLHIKGEIDGNKVKIVNLAGQVLIETNLTKWDNLIDVSKLNNGVYFIYFIRKQDYKIVDQKFKLVIMKN